MPVNHRKIIAALLLCLCIVSTDAQGERPSVALVLPGSGARGFAIITVLEVIEELGIPLDMIVGVSSGAIIGGLYAIGYSPASILEIFSDKNWPSFFNDRPVSPFRNRNDELPLVLSLGSRGGPRRIGPVWERGFSSGQVAYQFIRSLTVKIPSYIDFDSLPIPFRAGAVGLPSGEFKLLGSGDLAEAIWASANFQGLFEPFSVDGRLYDDGGLLNVLPIQKVREMGFDIVIAVDIVPFPLEFSTSVMDIPDLKTILYHYQQIRGQHEFADVVLFPLQGEVSMVDFHRGREIHDLAASERETMKALLEPIRQRILESGFVPETTRAAYRDMPYLTPQGLTIQGALPRDRPYIERAFSRLIKGRPLQAENSAAFLKRIYETGNYRMVTARTDTRGGETYLELTLLPETHNRLLFRAGVDYAATFSSRSSGRIALRSGIEVLGRRGFSLLFENSVIDELSVGLSMIQPLGPRFFIGAEAELVRDQNLTVTGTINRGETEANRFLYFHGMLKGGLRFNRNNSLSIRPEYFWFRDEDQQHTMAGIAAVYTYSSLDHTLFPSRGFRGRVDYLLRFTPGSDPFNLLGVDLTAAIPAGRRFSIGIAAYASSLFGVTELPFRLSAFGFDTIHRRYFPHAHHVFCGKRRAALSFALQFEPLESLTLLGGRMIFSLAGAAGRFGSFEWNNWNNLRDNELIWNASAGMAILLSRLPDIQLRGGAGGGGGHRPAPFIALDLGMDGLRKRLFQ